MGESYLAATPVSKLPEECLVYLLGSRYCETDRLADMAWQLFGHLQPGAARVKAIVDYVHNHLTFGYAFARPTRTALEAVNEGVGVCRDFAHLTIALCRCLNIPARYVNGYLGDTRASGSGRHGFQRMDEGFSRRPLVHVGRPP